VPPLISNIGRKKSPQRAKGAERKWLEGRPMRRATDTVRTNDLLWRGLKRKSIASDKVGRREE